MDRKFRTITLVVFCVLGLTFLAQESASAQSIAGKEIRIGAAFCISGHGANVGKREAIGAQAAVDVISAAGGVNGVPLKLYIEDTASNPQEAVNVVRKLVADSKVLAIVGPHYSSEAEATFPLGNQLKIVQICVASSKPGLSAANRPYAFRNTLTEDKIADAVVKKFKKRYNIKKVAIITDIKDAVSKSVGTQVLPESYKANGIEIITGSDPVTFQTNDTQFTAQITKLKSMNPDGVGMGALGPDALNIITEARRQGMNQPFMSTAPLMEGEVPRKAARRWKEPFPEPSGTGVTILPRARNSKRPMKRRSNSTPRIHEVPRLLSRQRLRCGLHDRRSRQEKGRHQQTRRSGKGPGQDHGVLGHPQKL